MDLINLGKSIHRLGSPDLSWVEFREIIRRLSPDSEYEKINNPMGVFDTPELSLIISLLDVLQGANWQRSGGKGPRPQPVYEQLKKQLLKPVVDESITVQKMADIRARLRAKQKKATG